jgi:hypothetical protein
MADPLYQGTMKMLLILDPEGQETDILALRLQPNGWYNHYGT